MNTFFKILGFIAAAVFISFIASSLAESFDIEFALYGSYVIWILALCLLYMILPVKPVSIFSESDVAKKMETAIPLPHITGGTSVRDYSIPVPQEAPPEPPSLSRRLIITTNQNQNKLYEYNI